MTVYGFGERKTPEAFRNECDRFIYLDVLDEIDEQAAATAHARVTTQKLRGDTKLVSTLRTAVTTAVGEDLWANLATVGHLVRAQQPDFDSRNWGYAKLSDLVRATELFIIEPRNGGGYQVRDNRHASD